MAGDSLKLKVINDDLRDLLSAAANCVSGVTASSSSSSSSSLDFPLWSSSRCILSSSPPPPAGHFYVTMPLPPSTLANTSRLICLTPGGCFCRSRSAGVNRLAVSLVCATHLARTGHRYLYPSCCPPLQQIPPRRNYEESQDAKNDTV